MKNISPEQVAETLVSHAVNLMGGEVFVAVSDSFGAPTYKSVKAIYVNAQNQFVIDTTGSEPQPGFELI